MQLTARARGLQTHEKCAECGQSEAKHRRSCLRSKTLRFHFEANQITEVETRGVISAFSKRYGVT